MSESNDVDMITEESGLKFCSHVKQRAEHLKLRISKLLQFCEDTEMSKHNRALLVSLIIPVTKGILDATDDFLTTVGREARKDAILRVTISCKHGLDVLSELCLPPVKPRWLTLQMPARVLESPIMKFD